MMWPPKIKQGLGSIKRSIETRKRKVMSLLLSVLWAPHHILRGRSDNVGHVQRREARMVGRCKTLSHRDCSRIGLFGGGGGRVLKGQRDMMLLLVLFYLFFNLKVSHVVLTCLCRSSRTNTEHKLQKVPQVQNGVPQRLWVPCHGEDGWPTDSGRVEGFEQWMKLDSDEMGSRGSGVQLLH